MAHHAGYDIDEQIQFLEDKLDDATHGLYDGLKRCSSPGISAEQDAKYTNRIQAYSSAVLAILALIKVERDAKKR